MGYILYIRQYVFLNVLEYFFQCYVATLTLSLLKANLTKPRNRPTKPKGVTTQVKALNEDFLMMLFTLLLNRVHIFAIFFFSFEQRNKAVNSLIFRHLQVFCSLERRTLSHLKIRKAIKGNSQRFSRCLFKPVNGSTCSLFIIQLKLKFLPFLNCVLLWTPLFSGDFCIC